MGLGEPEPKVEDKSPLNSPVSTSQTGIITVNRPLDREQIPEYRLTISVKDNPENPRIARRVRLQGMGWGRGTALLDLSRWHGPGLDALQLQ